VLGYILGETMKLFRRNKQSTDTVPTEIQHYYQPEQRERAGVAWLLAAGVFILTLVLASGLFFGGKWAYHKLANKDTKKPATTLEVSQPGSGEQGTSSAGKPAPNSSSTPSSSPSSGNPTASAPAGTSAPSTTLPNTGPGDE
jgi:hypothetical protein